MMEPNPSLLALLPENQRKLIMELMETPVEYRPFLVVVWCMENPEGPEVLDRLLNWLAQEKKPSRSPWLDSYQNN